MKYIKSFDNEEDIISTYCIKDIDSSLLLEKVKGKITEIRSNYSVKSFKFGMADGKYKGRFNRYKTKNPRLKDNSKMVLLYEHVDRQPIIDFEIAIIDKFMDIDLNCKNKQRGGGELGCEPNFYVYMVITPLKMMIERVDIDENLSPV